MTDVHPNITLIRKIRPYMRMQEYITTRLHNT